MKTILDHFETTQQKHSDKIAVSSSEKAVTYSELNTMSNFLANKLNEIGIKHGDNVAICLERSVNMIISMLAVLKAGAAYVPISPDAPKNYITHLINDSNANLVICNSVPHEKNQNFSFLSESEVSKICESANNMQISNTGISGNNKACLMYTSGSTGKRKGIIISHHSIVNLVIEQSYFKLNENDKCLQLSHIEFDASTLEIWGTLLHGATLHLMPPGLPTLASISQQIKKNTISSLFLTTQLFNVFVENRLHDLLTVKQIIFGGEQASAKHVNKFLNAKKTDNRLINGYGLTECTTFSVCYEIMDECLDQIVPIGKPINHVKIFVVDDNLEPVDSDVAGELLIGGAGVAIGYNDIKLNDAAFLKNYRNEGLFYKTNDTVCQLSDGNVIFLGRKDRTIKLRGFRINLDEIENNLKNFPEISSAAAIFDSGSSAIIALIVSNVFKTDKEALEAIRLSSSLPCYSIPTRIILVKTLPENQTGKLDYSAIANICLEKTVSKNNGDICTTPLQEYINSLWLEELNIDSVSLTDDFFDLGGHSLNLMAILDKFQKNDQFPMLSKLIITDLFEYSTIQTLSAFADETAEDSLTTCTN